MNEKNRKLLAMLVVSSMLLVGCTGDTEVVVEDDDIDDIPSENVEQDQGESTPGVIIDIGGLSLIHI